METRRSVIDPLRKVLEQGELNFGFWGDIAENNQISDWEWGLYIQEKFKEYLLFPEKIMIFPETPLYYSLIPYGTRQSAIDFKNTPYSTQKLSVQYVGDPSIEWYEDVI